MVSYYEITMIYRCLLLMMHDIFTTMMIVLQLAYRSVVITISFLILTTLYFLSYTVVGMIASSIVFTVNY
jgi:hypothetical protein